MLPKLKPKAAQGVLALAAVLMVRAVFLARRPLWFDEIFTLWISRASVRGILSALRFDSGPPLYYLAAKPFVALAEVLHFDALSRVPSFLCGALLLAAAGSRRGGAGRPFLFLLAACPLLFFYSAEARAYSFLSLLSFLLFVAAFRHASGRKVVGSIAGICAALVLVHYLGLFVVASSGILCLMRRKWSFAAAHAAGAAVFLFWLPVAFHQPAASIAWSAESGIEPLLKSLGEAGFWAAAPVYFSGASVPLPAAGTLIGAILISGAALVSLRVASVRYALAFSLLPLLLAAAASLSTPIYFSGRTEMATLPVLLWAFARASKKIRAMIVPIAVSTAAGAATILLWFLHPPPEFFYLSTARAISQMTSRTDLVVASEWSYLPLRLESERGRLHSSLLAFPSSIAFHPGWFEPGRVEDSAKESVRLASAIAGAAPGSRILFAVPDDPALRGLIAPLLAGQPVEQVVLPSGDSLLEIRR